MSLEWLPASKPNDATERRRPGVGPQPGPGTARARLLMPKPRRARRRPQSDAAGIGQDRRPPLPPRRPPPESREGRAVAEGVAGWRPGPARTSPAGAPAAATDTLQRGRGRKAAVRRPNRQRLVRAPLRRPPVTPARSPEARPGVAGSTRKARPRPPPFCPQRREAGPSGITVQTGWVGPPRGPGPDPNRPAPAQRGGSEARRKTVRWARSRWSKH